MNATRILTAAATVATIIMGPAIAHAQEDLPPSVAARKAQMGLYAFNLGQLGAMAKGEVDYDADAATAAASNLVKLSSLAAGPMWVPGTDTESIDGTRALPALWENMADVVEKATAVNEAAVAMEAAAGESLEGLQGAMAGLGQACGSCHKAYREPN